MDDFTNIELAPSTTPSIEVPKSPSLDGPKQELAIYSEHQVQADGLQKLENQIPEGRHVIMGDVPIIEVFQNKIGDKEIGELKENFNTFKEMISTSTDLKEQEFLSSRHVFRSVMGIEPESSFTPAEARVYYQALKRVGVTDKYSMLTDSYETDVVFLHNPNVEKTLRANEDLLGVYLPKDLATPDQISEAIVKIYSLPDITLRNEAIGLLSGFPRSSVEFFVKTKKDSLGSFSLKKLSNTNTAYLNAPGPSNLDSERAAEVYSRPYLFFGESAEPHNGEVAIGAFGTVFTAEYPLKEDVSDYCQKLLEIDRRLDVLPYVGETKGLINVKKEIDTLIEERTEKPEIVLAGTTQAKPENGLKKWLKSVFNNQ